MGILSWLIIIGLVLFFYIGFAIVSELRQLRAILTERVGSLAEAAWRVRDELAQINKRNTPTGI
jgi:hypothetical protein